MTEAMSERERFEMNPLRLLRCGLELGKMSLVNALQRVDEAQDCWGYPGWDMDIHFTPEAPVATEEELTDPLF